MSERCGVLRATIVLSLAVSITGCAVGPAYHPPDPPAVTRYPSAPLPDEPVSTDIVGGQAQRFVSRDIPAAWWTLFENEALDALVRQALLDNPRLAQVNARLLQARENLGARQGGTKYPQVDLNGSVNGVGVTTGSFSSNGLSQNLA